MQSLWKRQLPVLVAASLVFTAWPLSAAASGSVAAAPRFASTNAVDQAPEQSNLPANGEVIVKFRQRTAGTMSISTASTVETRGGTVLHQDPQSRMVVKLPKEPAQAGALLAALRRMPEVAYVENNDVMKASGAPNDARYSELWGLRAMNVPAAWTPAPVGARQVVVAVVDTGADNTHPDLAGRVLPGFNVLNQNTTSMDDNGHGTHVSGTIAADYNNGIGIVGVAGPADVRILPVKVLDALGNGNVYTVANGIDWAADHGADIINLSLGGGHSDTLQDAIVRAESKGVVVVVAAGNNAKDTAAFSPADAPGAVTVAALNENSQPAYFTNFGDQVKVIAPGVNILSTVPAAIVPGSTATDGEYQAWSGTSMAAPHVAGLAALLKAAHPEFTRWAIQACIYATATPIAQTGYGYGLPQADKVLACDPSALASQYALKLEGPDPDTAVSGSTAFWFDVKGGGARVTVKSSTGTVLGFAQHSGEGLVSLLADLSGLAPGTNTLTATLSDPSGAVLATHSFPVAVAPPAAIGVGLSLSTTQFNPVKETLKITTTLSADTKYSMTVQDKAGNTVKTLVSHRTYTAPVLWDGKGDSGSDRWVPDGSYQIRVLTDAGTEALAAFELRVPPTPVTPTLRVVGPVVNLPAVNITGRLNPNFWVETRLKAPGAAEFTSVGMVTTAFPDGTFAGSAVLTGGEGTYEVQIRGVDPADSLNTSRWTASAKVQFDATAPVIQLTSPTPVNGVITTNQSRLMLAGTVEPGARVTASAGTTAAANIRTVSADSRGAWSIEFTIPRGADSLLLSAVDAAGNQAVEQRLAITMDTTPPQLTADSLTLTVGTAELKPQAEWGNYTFTTGKASQYVLNGVISEPIGKVVASSRQLRPTIDGTRFTVELAPALMNGRNTLSFDIYDVAGNKVRLSATVVLDSMKPTLFVSEKDRVLTPTHDAQGGVQPINATFTVNASEPLSELRVISGNDRPIDALPITKTASRDGRSWKVSITLPGDDAGWALQFAGVDLAGNVGEPDARSRRQVLIDGTAPELTLTSSTDAVIFTTASSFTVAGTASDAGAGVKSVTVGRTVLTPNKAGGFSTRVTLREGMMTAIPVVVLDLAGNKRSATIQVVLKSRIDRLTVSTPRLTVDKQLSITGKTDASIVLPDHRMVATVPVTVVITDSHKVAQSYAALVNPDGTYSLTVDTSGWPAGRYSVAVTAGVPDGFAGPDTLFRSKTVTATTTIR